MVDMLASAATWLAGKTKTYLSTSVVYKRPSLVDSLGLEFGSVPDLKAMPDAVAMTHNVVMGGVYIDLSEHKDWKFTTADLILNSEVVLPETGDVIEETVDGTVYTYEVMPIGDEQHYRFTDANRIGTRVHTKQISVES